MASKVGSLFVALGLDDKEFKAGMAGAVGSAQRSTKLIQMNFSTLNFRTFLYGMAGVYAVKRAIEGVMSPAIDFESQMAKVSTVLDKAAMNMLPAFTSQIQTMAKETGQSTEALSDALRDIIGSVIAPTEAMGLLKVANEAAIGGLTDTATTTSALVTVLKSYGMETSKAAEVSDVLFATVLRGRLTFEELASGIGVVAASAAQAGLKLEEVSAMVSVMTRAGLSADMAMISLANILNTFISPSTESAKAARELGFEMNTATIRAIGLSGVLQILSRASEEQVGAIFPNIRGLRGFMAALADTQGFAEDLTAAYGAHGMRLEAFEKQYNTMKETLKRFAQVLLQDVVNPFTKALLPSINDLIRSTQTWIETNRTLIRTELTEWAVKTKNALSAIVSFVIEWHKPFVVAMGLMFGVSVAQNIINVGASMVRVTGYIYGLAQAVTALQLATLPAGVWGLGALAIGGAVYIGVKAIRDHLTDISRMKAEPGSIIESMSGASDKMTDVFGTNIAAKNMEALSAKFREAAKEGKSFGDTWKAFMGATSGKTLDLFNMSSDMVWKEMDKVYRDAARKSPKSPPVGASDTDLKEWEEYQSKMRDMIFAQVEFDNALKEQAYEDELERQKTLAEDTLKLTRDTEMEKTNLVKSGVDRNIAQIELEKQWYLEDLKTRYAGTVGYMQAVTTANAYYAALIKNAQAEAADEATRAWQAFQDHFSHVLVRMVGEGELSARKIANAFRDAIKRIAVEQAARGFTNALFSLIAPEGGMIYGFLDKIGAFATGGMVYKPSLALVGESGPERILNPSETQRYNQSTSDDHSSVEIHIHTDADGLATMNPYKFAQMYKEAKRSQLLKGA